MKLYTEPLIADRFYHVYNRGINGQNVFIQERNYAYFLEKYAQHISPVADTYAYCLLKNHFHFLIRTKSEAEILENATQISRATTQPRTASWYISNQFAKLFNGYAQALSNAVGRTGGLFEEPFRRIEVTSDAYFTSMIHYIHTNPQKHGFVSDFRDYPYSSYHSHLSSKATRLRRDEVVSWFGSAGHFERFHASLADEASIEEWIIEID